jgi:hypothetical protein
MDADHQEGRRLVGLDLRYNLAAQPGRGLKAYSTISQARGDHALWVLERQKDESERRVMCGRRLRAGHMTCTRPERGDLGGLHASIAAGSRDTAHGRACAARRNAHALTGSRPHADAAVSVRPIDAVVHVVVGIRARSRHRRTARTHSRRSRCRKISTDSGRGARRCVGVQNATTYRRYRLMDVLHGYVADAELFRDYADTGLL